MTMAPQAPTGELKSAPLQAEEAPDQHVREALAAYFGTEVIVQDYDVYLRKDYKGPASAKVQVGGAMIVKCNVMTEEGLEPHELVVDDRNRPFDDEVLGALGATANANWDDPEQPRHVRDYGNS
ncbi:MAG: hypothetical protein JWM37_476 [Candidatus Saccharibacteria bacterium]|nr:hypothetical protein [Candidatus Saccharibacteria bacterium]